MTYDLVDLDDPVTHETHETPVPLLILSFFLFTIDVHRGVVGNIQAFHVCAPGSIPGDGVFFPCPSFFFIPLSPFYSLITGYRP